MNSTPFDAWVRPGESVQATPLVLVGSSEFEAVLGPFGDDIRRLCAANDFHGESGRFLGIPSDSGEGSVMFAGCNGRDGLFALASLPVRLPPGNYAIDPRGMTLDPHQVALGWALGAYRYSRYRKPARAVARLVVEDDVRERVKSLAEAAYLTRDLINAPTQDMGPADLAAAVRDLAGRHGGEYREWIGDELIEGNFPTIHAVGRAAAEDRAPRLAMLSHGPADAPHLVLVGKGVCFDTGGLDLETADGMRWMKKDMGGAAPAILTRAKLSVEIDNTDAEGRLVLCDALAYAGELKPDLILDFATLTGAARIALGADLPALFCNRDDIADGLLAAGTRTQDPLWRMPLWRPYITMLDSYIADLANSGSSRHAGAISAALFLERFVPEATAWCHLDVYSWNDSERPGRPRGGEAQGLRAYLEFLRQRYGAAGGNGE
ncbi:MAG TPA: leucyl aminopeptidase family protein [Dokdonella sp.]|nr:leucyl aminopeptidase family protein [Dokdonella sp.]